MTTRRGALLLVLGLVALVDCEQRLSAYPPPLTPKTPSDESLLLTAVRLLDLVDSGSGLTLDVVHTTGVKGCQISMAKLATDAGGAPCLIDEPERPPPRDRGGIHF